MKHELVGKSLDIEVDGVIARCTCGWISRGHFSGFTASAAFQEHKEESDDAVTREGG